MLESDSVDVKNFIKLIVYFSKFNPEKVIEQKEWSKVLNNAQLSTWKENSKPIPVRCQLISKEVEFVEYDEDVKLLHQEMDAFYKLIRKNSPEELKKNLQLFTFNFTLRLISTVTIGEIKLRLKSLGKTPLGLFWAAVDGLKNEGCSKEQKAFLRRVAVIALCGGIPIHLLEKMENFEYNSEQFQSIGLPIGDDAAVDQGFVKLTEDLFHDLQMEKEKNVSFSEASLRLILWDPLFTKCFIDRTPDSKLWAIRSEVKLKNILNLDCERIADLTVFDIKFKKVILVIEAALESFLNNVSHKDFSKMNSLLTISCIDLAKCLADKGLDPLFARSFGVLVGDCRFQFVVAHPVLTEADDNECDIRVDVSANPHWYGDLGGDESTSLRCKNRCCMERTLEPIIKSSTTISMPTNEASKETIEFLKNTDLAEENIVEDECPPITEHELEIDSNAMDVDSVDKKYEGVEQPVEMEEERNPFEDNEEEIPDCVGPVETVPENPNEINMAELKKLSIFIKVVKDYIKRLSELKEDTPSRPARKFNEPNLAYVPVASGGSIEETPAEKQFMGATRRTDSDLDSSPISNRYRAFSKTKHESELYTKKLNSYFCFPRVLDIWNFTPGPVDIDFESMIPLIGNGLFGPRGDLFGPQICTKSPLHLILDACTFAVHSLYGLYVLHELVGYVHADISPENILFSPGDDIWKLCDFETALPIEKSLETARKCGTTNYVAPESLKTGIFTKESDVYALGQVLWRTFHTQIMWLCSFEEEEGSKTQKSYEEFFEAVKSMIKDVPSERPSVISSMKSFNQIIKDNTIKDFHIYGSEKLMIFAEKLTESFSDEKVVDEMSFKEITTNSM